MPPVEELAEEAQDVPEIRAETGPPGESRLPFAEVVQAIRAEDIIGGSRDSLIKALVATDHSFELVVKRVERTIAMFSEPDYRNGRTVSGTIGATAIEVSVSYPFVLNEEIDSVEPGSILSVCGTVSDWDGLRRQPRIRVEVT